jgi:hypothetical protein
VLNEHPNPWGARNMEGHKMTTLNYDQIIEHCDSIYQSYHGEGEWCLTNLAGSYTKVVSKDKKGYTPFIQKLTDDQVDEININFGISKDEEFKILGSTF